MRWAVALSVTKPAELIRICSAMLPPSARVPNAKYEALFAEVPFSFAALMRPKVT